MTLSTAQPRVGVVAIGRNEGERLVRSLTSAIGSGATVVYVDSNSTDGSVDAARKLGVHVVELDLSVPFTAARARNEGFAKLAQIEPGIELVQFVDGDCEIQPGWMERAVAELSADPKLGVVCGRRRERFPEASIYNRLCDIEWETPIGVARSCGGDAMIRAAALRQVNGYNPSVIAGEEPEMCVRLRQAGWTIRRVDAEMTLHDAAMTRFGQWWRRAVRAGHAYAEGAARHGAPPERHNVKQVRSIWAWGLAMPALVVVLLVASVRWHWLAAVAAVLLLGYAVLALRVWRYMRSRGFPSRHAMLYAAFVVLGKFPSLVGMLKYRKDRLLGRESRVIEYKGPAAKVEAPVPQKTLEGREIA